MSALDDCSLDIQQLCVSHKVKTLYAFGSVLTENFNLESDLDLVVDFENLDLHEYADNYFDLKFSLQDILKRPVDLLEEKAIKNPFFRKTLDTQKKLIYAR
jgi:predicted nucleotidyltransferase